MVEFRRICNDLVYLRFHVIGIAALVHIADVVQVKDRKVESLRPRLKFSLRERLQPIVLRKTFKRSELEHAKGTQLIFDDRMVRIRRISRCRGTAFGFIVRIAECRTIQEDLRHDFAKLRFASMVVLTVTNTKRLVAYIGLVALRFRIVTQALFFLVAIHLQLVLEHVTGKVDKAALLKHHVVGRLHVRALRRAMVTQGKRNVESGTVIQELVQVHREVARHIELRGRYRSLRLGRSVRSRKRCKVAVLVADSARKRNKVSEIHLAACTRRITPFGIHIRKAKVINPEGTLKIVGRGARIRNNHEAHPVDACNRGVTHQADLFFTVATQVFFDRIQVRRTAATLQVGKVSDIHGKGVIEPVAFMAIRITVAFTLVAGIVDRAEAPFVVIARTFERTFTELDCKADRNRGCVCFVMDFHLDRAVT